MNNWRPITILPIPGKLLEKCIHMQLSSHFELNKLLNDNQHGFWKNHSTGEAIFDHLSLVYQNINSSLITSCIYVDYSRAFDSLDLDILLFKLKC